MILIIIYYVYYAKIVFNSFSAYISNKSLNNNGINMAILKNKKVWLNINKSDISGNARNFY